MNPRPVNFDPTVRRSIEDEIQRLVDLLDTIDPDPDLESDLDGEPGTWTEFMQSRGYCSNDDENREPGGDDEPDHEGEPSLGWTATMDQTVSARSSSWAVLDGEEDVGEMFPGRPGRA